jgi:dipeptidyl aminopeptidase/acylaminoacyl peptidase
VPLRPSAPGPPGAWNPLHSRCLLALALFLSFASCARSPRKEPPPPPAGLPQQPPPQQPAETQPTPPSPLPEQPQPKSLPPEAAIRPPYHGPTGIFEAREYRSAEGQALPYRLFTPNGYDPSKQYPLILFLHGASARGADNERQLGGAGQWGTVLWVQQETQQQHPAFVLAPQANRNDSRWVRQWRADPARDPADKEPLELVVELIDSLEREFSIDPDRLYITGLSMGGFGVWIAISRYPDKFAAAIPICGGGDPSAIGETTAKVWAFHGAADTLVPPRRSREMIEALRRGGADPRYSEYPGVGHNAWQRAYHEPELVEWLFAQRREASRAGDQAAVKGR